MGRLKNIAPKITNIVFAQQSLASSGIIATATLNSIVSNELNQPADWVGVPPAVYLLGGNLYAVYIGGPGIAIL